MNRRFPLHRWLAATLLLAVGCSAPGNLELVSMSFQSIDPPAPFSHKLPLREATWWTDADGTLWIAGDHLTALPIGPVDRFTMQLSLRLPRLPNGKARNYTLTSDSLRAVLDLGPGRSRLQSTRGIAAVYREPGDRLRVSVRCQTARQNRGLSDWTKPEPFLLLAEFVARHAADPAAGRVVVQATEGDGFERAAPAP